MANECPAFCDKRITKNEQGIDKLNDRVIEVDNKREKTAQRIHDRVDSVDKSKVGIKVFFSLIGLFILVATTGITYTNKVDSKLVENYATKKEMKDSETRLEKEIKEVEERLNKKLDNNTDQIIKAIENIKK